MVGQSISTRSRESDTEDEPLQVKKYRRQQNPSFATWKWLLFAFGSAAVLCLAAPRLHERVLDSESRRRQALPNSTSVHHPEKVDANAARSDSTSHLEPATGGSSPQVVAPASGARPLREKRILTGREFHMCNAAAPAANLDGAVPDSILKEPCGERDAARIAMVLQNWGYRFDQILPQPYIYPAYLQQVLSMLDGSALDMALKHLLVTAPTGNLATLVQFFAWGLPVAMRDLEDVFDSDAIGSLRSCGVLAKCTHLQDMVTSSIMIFPVPNSSLLIATDWASRSTKDMHEEVVPIVDPEGMALVYNSPNPKDLKVLDYDSGPGLHGFMAERRGAAEVTMYSRSERAIRFIRFSSWMNKVPVKLLLGPHDQLDDVYDLMLAQPAFMLVPNVHAAAKYRRNGGKDGTKALRDVLAVASKVLSSLGLLALYTEFNAEDLINRESNKNICQLGLRGFAGSTVIRSQPLQPDAYASAHADVADVNVQLSSMRDEGITGISNGFLFARRQDTPWQKNECGEISLQLINDPIKWPSMVTSKYERACYLSRETQCPDSEE